MTATPVGARRSRLTWLPNALTLTRLAALPLLVVVLVRAEGPTSALAAWLFAAIALTDLLDGQLARALGAESRFGRIADPLVDRLLIAVGLVGLILLDRIHPTAPAIVLARDALAVMGFAVYAARGVELRVDLLGKGSAALTMVATALALLVAEGWAEALFWAAAVVSVATFVNYAVAVARRRPSVSTGG